MKNTQYLLLGLLFSSVVFSGHEVTNNPVRERANKETWSEGSLKKFEKLQELIADDRNAEAKAGLIELSNKSRLNGYEKAVVNQFLGYVEGNNDNLVKAAEYFTKAIDSQALPNINHFSVMAQRAQILMAAGKYREGIKALHDYYKVTDKITDQQFALEANANSQLEQYEKAIPLLKKAISLSDKPNERWNYLLYSLHMQLSQFTEAARVLEYLITLNPEKKEYFKRLSAVYFNLKKDAKALAVLMLADEKGMLKDEKEIKQLYKLYAFNQVPYKAGKVLEKGLRDGMIERSFKNWDDLGKLWYTASEMDNALVAYDEASKLATDGKIDIQRAYIYFDRELWPKAKEALSAAIEKGGITDKQTGNAWMLLGMAEYEMGNVQPAMKALNEGTKFSNTRRSSIQWLDHIKESEKRKKEIAEAKRINDAADEDNI